MKRSEVKFQKTDIIEKDTEHSVSAIWQCECMQRYPRFQGRQALSD